MPIRHYKDGAIGVFDDNGKETITYPFDDPRPMGIIEIRKERDSKLEFYDKCFYTLFWMGSLVIAFMVGFIVGKM